MSLRNKLRFVGATDTGKVREHNEDTIAVDPDIGLLVLADGMGGYAGGSLASRVVVEAFVENFCFCRGGIPERLLSSLRASERRLLAEIERQDESLSQMGSTLVGAVWTPGALQWVSVGDTGLYLYRERRVKRLNADHSMAPVLEAQAARGEITAEQAAHHPDRNALRSAIAAARRWRAHIRSGARPPAGR